jgi:hypothetical protein
LAIGVEFNALGPSDCYCFLKETIKNFEKFGMLKKFSVFESSECKGCVHGSIPGELSPFRELEVRAEFDVDTLGSEGF